ncbi:MAG: hypothetical protein GH144_11210 [Clostridia bacterium]|jgi:hypothetical protein|nr:hypothetical protein [Clostridia bacterium]
MKGVNKMTKRERVEATLNFEEPDRIPIYDLLFNDEAISYYAKRKLTLKNGPETVLEAISNCLDMTRSIAFPQKPKVTERDGFIYRVERWTTWVEKRPFKTVKELSCFVEKEIKKLNNPQKVYLDSMGSLILMDSGKFVEDFRNDFLWRKKRLKGTVELLTCSPVGLDTAFNIAGLDLFIYLYAENPQLVSAWLEALNLAEIRRVHAIADYELSPLTLVYSDIAFKDKTIFSSDFFKKEFYPRLERLVKAWHEHNIKCLFHSDGNLTSILPDLVKTGIDGLNPIETAAGMSLKEVKDLYGDKIFLAGGIDVSELMPYGTKEEVERGVIQAIRDAGYGSGYFLGSTTELDNGIPAKNIITMIKTAHEYGRYPLSN